MESDYAMNGATPLEADVTTHWIVDPQYTTQRWTRRADGEPPAARPRRDYRAGRQL